MASEDILLQSLTASLAKARRRLDVYDQYLEGEQPITFLAPALRAEFGERITELVINFPRMVVNALAPRLRVEGFRYAGDSSGDQQLWDVWQANDLDEQSTLAHAESIGMSRSYVIVGSGDAPDDPPIITVESPLQVFARRDPRTRRVESAIKRWDDLDDLGNVMQQHAVLYLPDSTTSYVVGGGGSWTQVSVDEHQMGRVPVVPFVNRPRLLRPDGISEFHDAMPLADAANKMATDMMVSGEFHAMPRRWAAGVEDKDFEDENGNPINAWSRDAGTLWAVKNKDAKFGQFNESDLAVFRETIKMLAEMIVNLTGLPPHYSPFAGGAANPTSSEALRVAETRMVTTLEGDKQIILGGAWEDVNRIVLRIMTGAWDPRARSLETIWRDAAAATAAQRADATLKLATPIQGGRALVPIEQARIDLGYTFEQRKRMAEMDREAATDPYLEVMKAADQQAAQQQTTTQQAAQSGSAASALVG